MIQVIYDFMGLMLTVGMVGAGMVAGAVVFSGMFIKLTGWRL